MQQCLSITIISQKVITVKLCFQSLKTKVSYGINVSTKVHYQHSFHVQISLHGMI